MNKYVEIELPDNFERGDCYSCPFGHEESYYYDDDGWDYWTNCSLGYDYEECELKVKVKL